MCLKSLIVNLIFYAVVAKDLLNFEIFTFRAYGSALYRYFFPRPLKSLRNEKILITGAANGIGREISLQLASSGATLICWDITKRDNDVLVQELKALGANAYGYEIDISERTQVESVGSQISQDIGEVTIIINNAGIMPCHQFLSHNPREIQRVFQVNVLAQLWILRQFLPKMIERKEGHIVTMSSIAGLVGVRNLVPYCGTKHAANGCIEALKDEIRHHPEKPDIKFTTVYPSFCSTHFAQNREVSRFPSLVPQLLEPEFIAQKVIDGIRRNYEYIYIPRIVQLFGATAKALLPTVQRAGIDILEHYAEPTDARG